MSTEKSFINIERLMGQLQNFFKRPDAVILELAQNASRACANKFSVSIKEGVLIAEDDGEGISDPLPLFVLAESGWSQNINENQMSAGFGLFTLFAVAEQVTFRSKFGSIMVDCKNFLGNESYRRRMLDMVDANDKRDGFMVEAVLKAEAKKDLEKYDVSTLKYFPFKVKFNGRNVFRENPAADNDYDIRTQYMGNEVLISSSQVYRKGILVIWYGIPIEYDHRPIRGSKYDAVINVTNGTPLTPVLPYREDIKEDTRLDSFKEFVRQETVNYCIDVINNNKIPEQDDVLLLMKTIKEIGTQQELNRLNRFYVTHTVGYHQLLYQDGQSKTQCVDCTTRVTDESVAINLIQTRDGEKVKELTEHPTEEDLVLPHGIAYEADDNGNKPDWLKIEPVKVNITITPVGKVFSGSYVRWQRAKIKCDGKNVPILYFNGTVYYAGTPQKISEINDALFELCFYDRDNDYDPQKESWDEDLDADIMKITKVYSQDVLLQALAKYSGFPVEKIRSVTVNDSRIIVATSKQKRILKIAA